MATRMLTEADVQRLMSSPSGDVRAETASKVAQAFDTGSLSTTERELASAIFRAMVKDAEVMVREALAQNLKSNPDLPKDVALSLAKDIESVSLPVLEYSTVLGDADLIEIVRVAGAEKQAAIARRAEVSGAVAEALVDHSRDPIVVTTLVANPGARLDAPVIERPSDWLARSENATVPWAAATESGWKAYADNGTLVNVPEVVIASSRPLYG